MRTTHKNLPKKEGIKVNKPVQQHSLPVINEELIAAIEASPFFQEKMRDAVEALSKLKGPLRLKSL